MRIKIGKREKDLYVKSKCRKEANGTNLGRNISRDFPGHHMLT